MERLANVLADFDALDESRCWAAAMAYAYVLGEEPEFLELIGPSTGHGCSKAFITAGEAVLIHLLGLQVSHDLGGCNIHPGGGAWIIMREILAEIEKELPAYRLAIEYARRCLRCGE